ncbi:phospho-2-dehydro-3-deoxyheptonate aldolase [Streptomyces pluripotens]|uniref:Phospho-2-dehydro-3-deoxyheptonate aldolase n=1 Tax=Streptomyces pluripotens TaxID=1355015 RepID=A0A221P9A0_9ACTN|nr:MULTISPECIES: 3-deoxy-7-phosphoheptulonate synthase [Streptomyces]ARP74457.1 phospho-2-dehydro-3-deoxyheptonate aldolase [Streptomyces pluripotens]ASN28732.1 phospho-2-dehydro-3-deoxyheptonate aldolase [Streptomyces pluripotens]MCH0559881.1 3-deoxy-7-phosphoheptulonate synthase [Streptomyces sp. MUM 16J]
MLTRSSTKVAPAPAARDLGLGPARQQPHWPDAALARRVRGQLAALPGLLEADEVLALRTRLAAVATGAVRVVQAGDCAEDPADCTPGDVARKSELLELLAGRMEESTGRSVLRVGRLAGQFAKPRSAQTERVGDLELPAYRGHMVNGPEPDPESRRPDPTRILSGYRLAGAVMRCLGWADRGAHPRPTPRVWTSHEALLLDYELPMVRRSASGRAWLSSTHWPWIGERTRQTDGAHVALLAQVVNPVACKVGPTMTTGELLVLCERLDPRREPGRLTLITRMGADEIGGRLPALVAAVRAAGHPVIWLCDPMHGNTFATPNGFKTRLLHRIVQEVTRFQDAVAAGGGVAGGLHLETTPDDVTECARTWEEAPHVGDRYTSLCDPRLNPDQAVAVVSAWRA